LREIALSIRGVNSERSLTPLDVNDINTPISENRTQLSKTRIGEIEEKAGSNPVIRSATHRFNNCFFGVQS
jgi:hypothetical protein